MNQPDRKDIDSQVGMPSSPKPLVADPDVARALSEPPLGDGSVTVSGDVVDSIIVTGDQNNVVGTLIVGSEAGVQELDVRFEQRVAGEYVVISNIGDERRPTVSTFRSPFSELELIGARAARRRGELNADARAYGERLFRALFTPPLLKLYRLCQDRPNLIRLRLHLHDAALNELPWELLWNEESTQWLLQRGTVVRSTDDSAKSRNVGPIATLSPFRVLVVDVQSQHRGADQIAINAAAMERSVADMEHARRLVLTRSAPSNTEALENAIVDAAGPECSLDVIHVLGTAEGDDTWSLTLLGALMQRYGVQVAAFSTAPSPSSSTSETLVRSGPALLEQDLAAVIGVPLKGIEEQDARTFRTFYSAVLDGAPVDLALAAAVRRRSRGSTSPDPLTGIPTCYLAAGEAIRFDVPSPPPIPLTWKTCLPWMHERTSVIGTVVASVTLAAMLALGLPSLWPVLFPEPLPVMGGSMNIAVAEFGQAGDGEAVKPWDRGAELASRFAAELNERRAPLDQAAASVAGSAVEIRGPELTGRITGATTSEREKAAEKLASSIQADLIVSGKVIEGGKRFLPEIFVSGRQGLNTIDPGFYAFGDIRFRPDANLFVSVNDQQELQQRLAQSTRSLVQFILGVNAFATRSYEEASSNFKDSVDASGLDLSAENLSSQGTHGLETLLLLMGDLDSKQAAASAGLGQRRALFESARAHYEQSLELDREFARAYVGLAEVTFLQSAGSCPRNSPAVDIDGLKSAIDLYRRALASKHQTPIANIEPKVHFGIGRATYCLSRAGLEGYSSADARRELQRVVDAYAGRSKRQPFEGLGDRGTRHEWRHHAD